MSFQQAPLVELAHVDVVVEGHRVLRDVSFRLSAAEHWGVVGANGSGKTSFLRLVAGTLWPAPGSGTRRYDFGTGPLTDAVRARREIALVGHELQDRYARWGWNFAALDVVLSGIFGQDVPRRSALAREADEAHAVLAELGLAHLAARPFLELSRGEQRRVLIARSIAQKPRVLLLDEPAAGLDVAARGTLDELLEVLGARTTIVCSAHAPEALPAIVTHRLRIENGRVAQAPADTDRHRGEAVRPADRAAETSRVRPPPSAAGEASEAPLIEVEAANIWLGERRVLSDIHWSLERGQHWLVTGGNGAGKSTFLRLLHGQLRPARGGRIRWPALGDPRNVWRLRRQVAWVAPELQAAYRYPSTVRECVASGLDSSIGATRRLSAAETERVESLLARLELSALAGRRLVTLSYGQLRRALIARALVNHPRVLLLDEPWEGLDPHTIELMDAHLWDIVANGTQIVCATHLRDDAAHVTGGVFTHRLALEDGRIAGRWAGTLAQSGAVAMDPADAAEIEPVR